tara:strand:- start:752 stop:1186 length:435 start_codon:yes stop_codon:yes gene_type:complete
MSQGAQLGSCDMCGWQCRYTRATQTITYGGSIYSVCDDHAENPVSPKADDFGEAPSNSTDTSQQSARQSDKDVSPQCLTIIGVLALAPEGLIREEIAKRAGVVNQAACARLNTLEAQGLVIVDGEKRLAGTRRLQQVYKFRGAA